MPPRKYVYFGVFLLLQIGIFVYVNHYVLTVEPVLERSDRHDKTFVPSYRNASKVFQSLNHTKKPQSVPRDIDAVFIWMNTSDPAYHRQRHIFKRDDKPVYSFGELHRLRYQLRSLAAHIPWVRDVYIVTDGQVPFWLRTDSVKVVSHEDFMPKLCLPTWSHAAIEFNLHRIPSLSEEFLYIPDNIFAWREIPFSFFYTRGPHVYLDEPVPDCAPRCPWRIIGNGMCDASCNLPICAHDAGDCGTLADYQPSARELFAGVYHVTGLKRTVIDTNRAIGLRYGFAAARRQYAALPLLIDRRIMVDAETLFTEELQQTTCVTLPSAGDLNYGLFYAYHLIETRMVLEVREALAWYDADGDGVLQPEETEELIFDHFHGNGAGGAFAFAAMCFTCWRMNDLDTPLQEFDGRRLGAEIEVGMLAECLQYEDELRDVLRVVDKFPHVVHEVEGETMVASHMLTTSVADADWHLHQLLDKESKFIYLDETGLQIPAYHADNQHVYHVLLVFLQQTFPQSSKYELD